MVNNEALERSGDDINRKLTGFNTLATKDDMKQFLVELNATIPRFKDQVRLTGSKPELKSRYREYLERSAELPVTNTPTTPSAGRPAAAPPSAAPKRVKRAKQAGEGREIGDKTSDDTEAAQRTATKRVRRATRTEESEEVGDKTIDDTQDTMPSMLSRLFVADGAQLSTPTLTCLDALGSPLSAVAAQKPENEDLSSRLWPLVDPISTLISARDSIIPMHSYLDNFGRLAAAIRKLPVTAPACFSSFLTSIHFTVVVDRGDAGDTLAVSEKEPEDTSLEEAAVMAEVGILSNEVNRALSRWSSSFPSPPSDSMIYPVDFNQTERTELRAFARQYITRNSHLSKLGVVREVLLATSKDFRATWPIGRGGTLTTAINLLVEARKNVNFVKGKSPSAKSPNREVGEKEE
ncbi:uncharacterized protein J4E84_000248 [Alternaria hordeiaustralica]|uniref:uncharacterized protein n=1 Tax=Alternaria hordeiaustralica TaxID=1187925 RepID=UPI0020C34DFF|nr:uncharacterized protein J4E84_000248 [Alternaria hordeiaustralica]KAI4697123.1 hypothetical protein J4E84_000248 [Alternaria hordeiaustralica]